MSFKLADAPKTTECTTKDQVLALAAELDMLGGTIGERAESERREAWLKEIILAGETLPFIWASAKIPTEVPPFEQRVNGQHSSKVFLQLSDEEWEQVQWPIVIIMQKYLCDSREDFGVLFEQFDNARSLRSKADKIGVHLGFYPDVEPHLKDRDMAVHLIRGLRWYRSKVDGLKITDEGEFHLIHMNHDIHAFLRFGGSFLSHKKTPELLRDSILAAMYHTTRREPRDAQDFWLGVASGIGHHAADSVSYKLADFFMCYHQKNYPWPQSIQRHLKKGKKPSDLDVFATCLRAFMTWRRDIKMGEIFISSRGKDAAELVKQFYPLPPEEVAA